VLILIIMTITIIIIITKNGGQACLSPLISALHSYILTDQKLIITGLNR